MTGVRLTFTPDAAVDSALTADYVFEASGYKGNASAAMVQYLAGTLDYSIEVDMPFVSSPAKPFGLRESVY
ncbi:hypothetical protein KIPB_005527 [Kipferlia bialata]|uniref:Uncharacterized protein n=1 Tax=Kipferlia bialata TaxID=797122 RepID=A0A9K3CVR2_9EUKA|nr:hypothetical protein KIPB_005527 [Kipferlia bialata]|eukprot:g5527.t1